MAGYLLCTSGYPAICDQLTKNTDNISNELINWFSMQMYVCEFIVPSIKEHLDCFADLQIEQNCALSSSAAFKSFVFFTICKLIIFLFFYINKITKFRSYI